MEPERPIEKLLRESAKKRREGSGPPLELHPANRRMLQAEVARRATRPSRGGGWLEILAGFLPKLAGIFGVLVIAAVGATLLFRGLNQPAKKAQLTLASGEATRSVPPVAAQNPAPAGAAPAAAPQESAAANANGETKFAFDRQRAAPVVENTPRTPPGPANEAENSKATMVKGEISSSPPAITDKLAAKESTFGAGIANQNSVPDLPVANSQNYVQVAPVSNQAVSGIVSAAGSAIVSPILVSFRVEQNGSDMRIVDADGSVYAGSLQFEKASSSAGREFARKDDRYKAAAPQGIAQKATRSEPSYLFQVSGTNRSLNQSVTFNGRLFTTTKVPASSAWTNLVAPQEAQRQSPGQMFLLPLDSSSLNGTAVINNTEAIQIHAVPAAP